MAKAEAKTQVQDILPETLIASIERPERRADAKRLLTIFAEVTGFSPKVWSGIFGFGRYDYRYPSGHSGTCFATGFAVRKTEMVLYIMPGYAEFGAILADLGPHRIGKSCLYLKRLEGINETALRRLICVGLRDLARHCTIHPA